MQPYYEHSGITIYHGDCREILPTLGPVDLVLTDPPYPDCHTEAYRYADGLIDILAILECRQLVFWSAKTEFPLDYTAVHIWDKEIPCASEYERIFERNGERNFKLFRDQAIGNTVLARFRRDKFYGHPSQKPLRLLMLLINRFSKDGDAVLDAFAGTGTTLMAAKKAGRRATGIEIEERYCEIAANRLCQEVLAFA